MTSLFDVHFTHLGIALLRYIVFVPPGTMASIDHAPAYGTATDSEEKGTTDINMNYVERFETQDNDVSLAKVEADAKLDEFGARSKTNPAEIALVKKLDRTILVSSTKSNNRNSIADSEHQQPQLWIMYL